MNTKLFKTFVFTLLFFNVSIILLGQNNDTIVLVQNFKQLNINSNLTVITSDSTKNAIDILKEYQKNKFITIKEKPVGFSYDNYWVIFHIKNSSNEEQKINIVVKNPHIDFLTLYEQFNNLTIEKKYETGDRTVFRTRPVKNRLFLFPVSLKKSEIKSFLLKIDKRNAAVSFPISIVNSEIQYDKDYKFNLIYGSYFGIILLIFIYGIIGFFYLKDSTFFYYSLYALFLAIYFFTVLGYSFQYLYPNSVNANNHARVILIILILIFLILFTQKILKTKHYIPVLHKILTGIIIFSVLMLIKWIFFTQLYTPFTIVFLKIFYFTAFLFVIIITISIIKVYKHLKKIVLFYISAFSAFFLGSILVVFIEFGIIKEEIFIVNPMFIGSAIELIIFAFALSFQIKEIYEKNSELSVEVVKTQKQVMRSYLKGIDKERIRIAKELHDSVGSKINILKNSIDINSGNEDEISEQINDIAELVRDISHEIYLPEIKIQGLKSKLQILKRKFENTNNIKLVIDFYDFPNKLSDSIEKEIFHIIEEALNNIQKHAAANEVIIQLFGHEREINITIDDNGRGFDVFKKKTEIGIGLKIMNSRAESLNGTFEISSTHGRGTSIVVIIPV